MSFRKKLLIQERNLFIENKYLFEQEKTTGSATPISGNTVPTTGATISPTTTTTTKKITKLEINKLPDCSSFNKNKYQIQPGQKIDNITIYTLDGKDFCKKQV